MIRKFILVNSVNDTMDLLDLDIFAFDPDGLGVEFDTEFYQSGGHFIPGKQKLSHNPIKFNLIFGGGGENTYLAYDRLVEFLADGPYVLEYHTDAGEYKRDVKLSTLSKSEIGNFNHIIEDIEFLPLTPWYKEVKGVTPEVQQQEGDGKIYRYYEPNSWADDTHQLNYSYNTIFDYDYDGEFEIKKPSHAYTYPYVYEGWYDGKDGVFVVDNQSVLMDDYGGSPIEIVIHGPSKDPYWHILEGDEITQSDGFNINIPEGHKLVVKSNPSQPEAYLETNDGNRSNVYQQQRLDLTNFIKVPKGRSFLIFHNVEKVEFLFREERVVV